MVYIALWLAIFVVTELVALYIYKESIGFKVVKYNLITDKALPEPVSFVVISDLHNADLGNNNEQLLDKIDEINPNFIVLAGDMITSSSKPGDTPTVAFSFMERLASRYKVYYGLGNHEQRYLTDDVKYAGKFEEISKFADDNGITLLSDDSVDLEEYNCTVYGLNIPIDYYRRVVTRKLPDDYVNSIFPKKIDERYNIMLAHNPEQFDKCALWGPDLVCSGHVHGGIIGVPFLGGLISPQLKIFPKYYAGEYVSSNSTMILSRGIGWHTIPIRINNKAEIVHITVSSNCGDI